MNNGPITILLVEDNPGDADLVTETLESSGKLDFELIHMLCLEDGLRCLESSNVDVALLDLSLSDSHGLNSVIKATAITPDVPIVVLTGQDDEQLAIEAVRKGAQDYLVKGSHDGRTLIRTMRHAIERHGILQELEQTRQQQLITKDQFLSHVSHELRSPLTAIHQFVTIVLDGLAGKINSEQREYLEIATRNVNQLRSMIGDLLEATRIQSATHTLEPECVSLVGLIPDTVGMMEASASAKRIVMDIDLAGYLPYVHADANRVRQVLINLIDNAIKFTPEGGTIRIRAGVSRDDPGFMQMSVSDTGCGIGPEAVDHVFDRHFQEPNGVEMSRKGLGLGLYLCKEIVSRHGGRIWVESKLGYGSAFCFTLPAFSFETLLSPVMAQKRPGDSIALIPIEVFPLATASGRSIDKSVLQQAWDLLDACIVPDRELLLPRIATVGSGEIFFVVASIRNGDEASLVKRIHEQGANCQSIEGAHIDLRVLATVVESSHGHTKPLQPLAKGIAARIEDYLKIAV